MCTRPPTGWLCTRAAGHDGPCAARPDDEPPTPAQTPSAMHRLGLVICPKCKEDLTGALCDLCNGGRRVAVDVAIAWTTQHGDTEPPAAPSTKPEGT